MNHRNTTINTLMLVAFSSFLFNLSHFICFSKWIVSAEVLLCQTHPCTFKCTIANIKAELASHSGDKDTDVKLLKSFFGGSILSLPIMLTNPHEHPHHRELQNETVLLENTNQYLNLEQNVTELLCLPQLWCIKHNNWTTERHTVIPGWSNIMPVPGL